MKQALPKLKVLFQGILFLLFAVTASFSQTNGAAADSNNKVNAVSPTNASQRGIAFLGLPIGGNINDFLLKLAAKGFQKVEIKGDVAEYQGQFLDNMCEIWAVCSPITKIVWKVAVTFPEQTSWLPLKSNFTERCDNLTAKYGSPEHTCEKFVHPYKEGDGYEMQAVNLDKCKYLPRRF